MSITLTQIAEASNVSVSLVSRLMRDDPTLRVSDETRQRVLATKEKLHAELTRTSTRNAHSNRSLTFVASVTTELQRFVPNNADVFHMYQLLEELESQLAALGHMLMVGYHRSWPDVLKQINQICDEKHPADGVIFMWGGVDQEIQKVIIDRQFPHMIIHPAGNYEALQTIRPMKSESFRQLVNHLTSLGHDHIGFVGCHTRRYPWFAEAMTVTQRTLNEKLFCILDRDEPLKRSADWRATARQAFAQWFDRKPDCTAIVTDNDFVAFGVIDELEARGLKVGRDLAIASYGNIEAAMGEDEDSAILTTADEQIPKIVRRVVARLIEQVHERPTYGIHELIPGRLVVRKSSGASP